MQFDYDTFFNYYTNPNHVKLDRNPPSAQFYDDNNPNPISKRLKNQYIVVGNKRYYIKTKTKSGRMVKDSIMFSLPTKIPGQQGLWNVHYHFGVAPLENCRNMAFRGQTIHAVYFHKTTQDPRNTNKIHTNCYFKTDELIDDVVDLLTIHCLESKEKTMSNRPVLVRDIDVIQEIIRRPFYGPRYGGGHRRTKKSRRAVHRTRRQRPV